MQRRSAICTKFGMDLIRAQPRAARHTFRVDALHGPAGKILHSRLQNFSEHFRQQKRPLGKVGRILRHGACCVKKKTTISSRCVALRKIDDWITRMPQVFSRDQTCAAASSRVSLQRRRLRHARENAAPAADEVT